MNNQRRSVHDAALVDSLWSRDVGSPARVIDASSGLSDRFFPGMGPNRLLLLNSATELRRFSADVLLLDSLDRTAGMRFGDLHLVGIPVDGLVSIDRAVRDAPEQFMPFRILRRAGHSLLLLRRTKRAKPSARVFLDPRLGVEGLGAFVRDNQLRVVCLRWFDRLPDLAPGEDLDLLAHGDDLEKLRGWLTSRPGTIPVDLYSHDGRLPGSFGLTPYFPERLSHDLLDSAQAHPTGLSTPSPSTHFRSLAFHAVYHKGHASGLARDSTSPQPEGTFDHDYGEMLREVAQTAGIVVPPGPVTLEWLSRSIDDHGDRPSWESISILARRNPFILEQLRTSDVRGRYSDLPGTWTAYLVRQRTLETMPLDEAIETLAPERSRLHTFFTHRLSASESARLAASARGGNWGKGPFKAGGGPPVHLLLVRDARLHAKAAVSSAPTIFLENPRFQARKEKLRKAIAKLTDTPFNPCHSADSSLIAEEWLESLDDSTTEAIDSAFKTLTHEVTRFPHGTTHDVISRGTRAHAYRTSVDGVDAFVKNFYPWAQDAFDRELRAAGSLSVAGISPRIVATGERWIATEFHLQQETPFESPMSPVDAAEISQVVESARGAGWLLLDTHSKNFIRDSRTGRLLAVDLEDAVPATGSDSPPPTFQGAAANHSDRIDLTPRIRAKISTLGRSFRARKWHPRARSWIGRIYRLLRGPNIRRHLLRLRTLRHLLRSRITLE